jgi:eukaryotic-like serine/threonine-protein kinase
MATRPSHSTGRPTDPIASADPTLRRDDLDGTSGEGSFVRGDVGPAVEDGSLVRVEDRRTRRTRAPSDGGPLVLNRYRLQRRLGAGGFGTVWQARDERLDREVAVKLLPRERIVGGRFEREARAAARLSHPGIVTLYEAAVDDDGAYLVSELVRGATLGALLEAGRLSDRDIVQIGVALSDALIHAHTQGVVHRDVKPSNILVPQRPATPAQLAKLTDFGVARIIGGDTLTRTGDVIGTMAYMAPEQAEGLEAGAPADLYSLALVIYEALTGVNPVDSGTAARRARRLGAYLPPIRRQRRELPRALGCAIDLALRPRPRERGSVEELGDALQVSVGEMEDRPGVVASPWPSPRARTPSPEQPGAPRSPSPAVPRPEPSGQPWEADPEPIRTPIPWPERALGAAAAAGVAAWLAGAVLAPGVNPALAAVVAAVAVATLPRIGWLGLVAAAGAALAMQGRAGATLLVVIAGLLGPLLLPLRPARWPLGALAPALGAIGLAGAWPALAGRAGGVWQRAALGASGWMMLVAAETLAATNVYVRLPRAVGATSTWMSSLSGGADHALAPLVSTGVLVPALVWALAAATLPWFTLFRSLPLKLVLVTVWAAATASAVTTALHQTHAGAVVSTEAAVLGAIAAGVAALAPSIPGTIENWDREKRRDRSFVA